MDVHSPLPLISPCKRADACSRKARPDSCKESPIEPLSRCRWSVGVAGAASHVVATPAKGRLERLIARRHTAPWCAAWSGGEPVLAYAVISLSTIPSGSPKQMLVVALTAAVWLVIALAASPMIWLLIQPHVRAWLPAERRATVLLREMLTPEEFRQLSWMGYVDVPSPSYRNRTYRVPRTKGYVQVLEGGRAIMRLCLQPVDHIPDADIVLMHKLMIQANEASYLDQANKFPYRNGH